MAKLKLLFLKEWILNPQLENLANTIFQFENLQPNERLLFKELHLEFLKKSDDYRSWKVLLSEAI